MEEKTAEQTSQDTTQQKEEELMKWYEELLENTR